MPRRYETIQVSPITTAIGAQVDGADLAQPLSEHQVGEIRAALLDHLVLFFRGQDLTDDQHLAFASRFGTPNVYVATRARGLDQPLEWIEDTADSPPKADLWHTDVAFLPTPPDLAVLNIRAVPPTGGDTMWASLYAVYDKLSPPLRAIVDTLRLDVHPGQDFRAKLELQFGAGIFETIAAEFAGSTHPLVRVHPETGRRALYLCGAYVRGIAGMTAEESAALYGFLRSLVEDPNVQCRWRWQLHDLAIWDERCTNHRALADHHPHHRLVRRCTVGAATPVGVAG
jgi:taurine dioxygenase